MILSESNNLIRDMTSNFSEELIILDEVHNYLDDSVNPRLLSSGLWYIG